ncbi:MAG: galactokinase [Vicinamibacteria bacterium]|nr:galactokinase [Vicinamibacteria bacterium]
MIADVRTHLSTAAQLVADAAQDRADAALARLAGRRDVVRLFVPGRIEVLGKHTDYAGGRSLTCAAERGFSVSYVPRDDDLLRLVDARDGREAECRVDAALAPEVGHWSNYPMTVARRLSRNFGPLGRGADVAFCGTLPRAAGLSTSSALITAVFLVIAGVNRLAERPEFTAAIPDDLHLAGYLGSIENGSAFGRLDGDHGVGTSGGSEDHTAILLSQAGRLTWYRYHPVMPQGRVALDPDYVFVVAASGIAADKTGSAREKYNRASALVTEIVAIARRPELQFRRRGSVTLADVLDASPDASASLRQLLADVPASAFPSAALLGRLEHFLVEDRQVLPAALEALIAGRLAEFGALVDRSQRAAEELLGNQVPETVTLARLARDLGAHAASSFGAGFGGSVWALVDAARADAFRNDWLAAYAARHPNAATRAEAFVTRPGPGAGTTG